MTSINSTKLNTNSLEAHYLTAQVFYNNDDSGITIHNDIVIGKLLQ